MTMWRPIEGEVFGLDENLFDSEKFQEFFAAEQVLGRASEVDEDHYRLEIAVTGKRRRIAILDDQGEIIPGVPLTEFVDEMERAFRKSQISIGGEIRYGDLDLGEVDIDMADEGEVLRALDEDGDLTVASAQSAATPEEPEDLDEPGEEPLLVMSDLALAEIPTLASSSKAVLAIIPHGGIRAIVASRGVDVRRRIFPRPVFLLTLSTASEAGPVLTVQVDNQPAYRWTWDGQLPVLEWMAGVEPALEFATEHLGAGAVARRCVLESENASAIDVRHALLASKAMGPAYFVQAMGLPPEVVEVLNGSLDVHELPGSHIFEKGSFSDTMRDVVALEISGHGLVAPKAAKYYRKLFLDHPAAMNAVASVQAAVGGSVFAAALRSPRGRGSKWGAGLGAFLMVNSVSRVLTTQWIQRALERSESASQLAELAARAQESLEEKSDADHA